MREAAGRDRIAFQYAFDFVDIFETGGRLWRLPGSGGWPAPWPAVGVYLAFLAGFPDSHIARKHGLDAAARVQAEAREACERSMNAAHPADMLPGLLAFDRRLKDRGVKSGDKRRSHRRDAFRGPANSDLDQAAQ